jgi:hypothetical protein
MLSPPTRWGIAYPAVPFLYLNESLYQAVASRNATQITLTNGTQYMLDAGHFIEFHTDVGMIMANNPIELIEIGEVS